MLFRSYLKVLANRKDIQLVCVYEKREKLAVEIARIFEERFGDKAPLFEPASALGFEELVIPSTNTPEGLEALRQLRPDLMILGGAGIVKAEALDIPKWGTLNCHPGILPRYRGCTCVEWAIFEDQPVGVTCHFATKEIDAGDILLHEVMPVFAGQPYVEIRLNIFYFQAQVLGRAVEKLISSGGPKKAALEKFEWNQARYYKPIPAESMQEVLRKLASGEYACASVKS